MKPERVYSATLTGNPFLLYETRQMAGMIRGGGDISALRQQVIDTNAFHYRTPKSIPKRFNALYRRLEGLAPEILSVLEQGTSEEARITNLLVILRSDLLFYEFFKEIVLERLDSPNPCLTLTDFQWFFESKKEISPAMQQWTEPVYTKLRRVYVLILEGAGLLINKKTLRLQVLLIPTGLQKLLAQHFPGDLLTQIQGK